MRLKITFAIATIFSFINGIITFCKFYTYISFSELFLLIFFRVLITFIIFCSAGWGICYFLKQEIPQVFPKSKKPVSTKIDYVLPSVSPVTSLEETKSLHGEIKDANPEILAMVIRTIMAEE